MITLLVVASEADPVARAVLPYWGTPPSSGLHVDGAAIRELGPGVGLLRRAPLHIHDEHLDRIFPAELAAAPPTVVFPSVHRSERGDRCLTVHPLGNLGEEAEVGGSPHQLVPVDARRMTDALRRLTDASPAAGLPATFEATHHGPTLDAPAFFVEIGFGDAPEPPKEAAKVLAATIPQITGADGDRIVVGVGGGHYAPHFTDLAVKRRWAFGHLVSRHALEGLDPAMARRVVTATPGCEGALFARAADAIGETGAAFGPRLAEGSAPRREGRSTAG